MLKSARISAEQAQADVDGSNAYPPFRNHRARHFLEESIFRELFCAKLSAVTPANQTKEGQFRNFSQGHSGTKVRCESRLSSRGKTPELTKMGQIHELFVLALSLVWFAAATPEIGAIDWTK